MTRSTNMEHVEVLRHMKETIKAIAPSEIAALDAAIASLSAPKPPAESAPVGVLWDIESVEGDPNTLVVNTPDRKAWIAQRGDRVFELASALHLAQQPAAPTWIGIDWAEGQQPTAVDDLNAWRAAFIAERAMRYREGGMATEQARIHAETDAAHMEALATSQQPATCVGCEGKPAPENTPCAVCGQQPAAVDGASPYPDPRNRREAAALARLALAYLGATSAHIEAAVARCETDLAGQQGGSDNDR